MIQLFNKISYNGKQKYLKGENKAYLVATNLNAAIGYLAFVLFSIAVLVCVEKCYELTTSLFVGHVIFFTCFILINKGQIGIAKHILVIGCNSIIFYFDHRMGEQYHIHLTLFAMLPMVVTIFNYKTKRNIIFVYALLPIVLLLFAKFFSYQFATSFKFTVIHGKTLSSACLVIAYLLFVAFAVFNVINSINKQRHLVIQRLSRQRTLDCLHNAVWSIDNHYNLTVANAKFFIAILRYYEIYDAKLHDNLKTIGLWEKLSPSFQAVIKDVLAGQKVSVIIEQKERKHQVNGSPIIGERNEIIGASFSSNDVTEEFEFESQLLEAKQKAESGNKAKELFMNNMSHEIRTPLNGIIGIIDILKDETHLPSQVSHLNNLEQLSDHTLELISNVLDYSKLQNGKTQLEVCKFTISDIKQRMEALFQTTAKLKGISFEIVTLGNLKDSYKGDITRLNQILINLIGNAIKFTEQGGVTLEIEIDEKQGEEGCMLLCKVKDTGLGIKKENLNNIFGAFDQADHSITRKFGGTGLGLSISKKLVELMGGSLEVQSVYTIGSSFSFSIPVSKFIWQNNDAQNSLRSVTNEFLQNKKVLLAEDNKINQMVAKNILDKWGLVLTMVDNGVEAIEKLKSNQYDIVLMDLDMPIMDGYEATRIIRTLEDAVPIIALTAASFDNMSTVLLNKGFSGVVIKPFKKEILFNEMVNVLDSKTIFSNL